MRYTYHAKPPKLESACSTDQSRPALAAAYLDTDRAELQACTPYYAARVPVEVGLEETTGFVPVEALKASRKRDAGGMHCNGSADVMPAFWDGDSESSPVVSFPRPDAGQFPHLDQLWPTAPAAFRVGINAGFLLKLAQALGADDTTVVLEFQPTDPAADPELSHPTALRPIKVIPINGTDAREAPALGLARAEGIIMPIRCDNV